MKTAISAAIAVAFLSAALATTAATATAAPQTPSADVTAANADNGKTFSVHTGDRISVHLQGSRDNGVTWAWDVPASSSANLNRISGNTLSSGDAVATFTATGSGQYTITAHESCVVTSPGHLCPHIVELWQVAVAVH